MEDLQKVGENMGCLLYTSLPGHHALEGEPNVFRLYLKNRSGSMSVLEQDVRDVYKRQPVGKVNVINIFPMNFEEFLVAKGEEEACKLLMSGDFETISLLHDLSLIHI